MDDEVADTAADPRAPVLVGREPEIGAIDGLIGGLGRGDRSVLMISGDPGIGKSALLDHAREAAVRAGARTLGAVGVESEAEFPFAGLHQLVGPILDLADRLPEPRRRALEAAFGMADEPVPDRFHVALAAHQLILEAAASRPQVLLVDDAHWLDGSSIGVLTFIARRLDVAPVALVMTERDGHRGSLVAERLPRLRLDRLTAAEAAELLDRTAPGLHPIRRASLLAEAAGNPLALVELANSGHHETDRLDDLGAIPTDLTARLERTFAERLDDLAPDTRSVLLAAALDRRASLSEIVGAASVLRGERVALSAFDAAAAVGLIEIDGGEVRFEHPLVRSAVRQAAPPTEAIAMYAALAEVVDDEERRVWHRAMAAVGPDEDVAAALTVLATAAHRRGAVSAAAAALDRAVTLSEDPRRKGERLVGGAELAYELGQVEALRRLIRQAESVELGDLETARIAWLRQMISGDVWVQARASRTFVEIATRMAASGDSETALRSLVPIANRNWWTRTRTRTRHYLVEAAESLAGPGDEALLLAVVGIADPEGTAVAVRDRLSTLAASEVDDPLAAMDLGVAAEGVADFAAGLRFLSRALEGLREQGRLGPLTRALVHHAWAATHVGDWEQAAAAGAEAAMLADDTDQPTWGHIGALVAAVATAHRGDEPRLDVMISGPEAALLALTGSDSLLAPGRVARGADAIGDGRHSDAFSYLWPLFDEVDPAYHHFIRWSAVLDLVEAGIAIGEDEKVARVMGELEGVAERGGQPYLVSALACARPLLAGEERAEQLYAAASEASAEYPFLRARALFSRGRRLRHGRRAADSRGPLRKAIDIFDALGATRWADRARLELRATGETIGPRAPETRDLLTAQELQIAGLAAEGLSNREIGERLFLSHRTIGSHLYRIYPKLGISSRSQLRDALAAVARTPE